ncbi:BamA/TamA family outer membrane protein [Jeongeupia naejangsanensis]|uniref:BamA/TamA family outer membrane protein n=1 Tax=Jeongeupia naejangsanensis TaxID=613195 RepID=A0ABS2BHF1_9NEIS|nr:BamA/TamA family outer membrane protein [Jeongeupia naejangsanensis]MBM3115048.1 BamA/TamA family outer membrane protein [Jeongeupia naejangsanensis]
MRLFSTLSLTLALLLGPLAHADDGPSYRDPEDGQIDLSDYLLNHKGVFPVPIVITEPAIGYGGGAMLLYFQQSMAEAAAESEQETGRKQPPVISGLGGFATNNGTWAGGAFHFHPIDGDRYRYMGGIGKASLNLDYYGALNQARSYNLDGDFLFQQFLFRIGDSDWFVGPRYGYFRSDIRFGDNKATELGDVDITRSIGIGGLIIDYDSRDNIFFPRRGTYFEAELQMARSWLGSSSDFENYTARAYTWLPLTKTLTLGLRIDGRTIDGDYPFYSQPYIDLRGIEKGRYQDQNAAMTEAELRWDVTPRWSLLAFGGAGKAWGRWHDFGDAETVYSYGTGFRYLIAKKLGLASGLDFAWGPDGQRAFYIQMGSAWK